MEHINGGRLIIYLKSIVALLLKIKNTHRGDYNIKLKSKMMISKRYRLYYGMLVINLIVQILKLNFFMKNSGIIFCDKIMCWLVNGENWTNHTFLKYLCKYRVFVSGFLMTDWAFFFRDLGQTHVPLTALENIITMALGLKTLWVSFVFLKFIWLRYFG